MVASQQAKNEGAPLRRAYRFIPALLLTLVATALAVFPPAPNSPFAIPLGVLLVFFLPGYWLEQILFAPRQLTLTRLPVLFVLSLATWAIPATTLQILGSNWLAFRVLFVVVLWALSIVALVRAFRRAPPAEPLLTPDWLIELVLALVCLIVAAIVLNGPRDADDWGYLQVTQQFIGSNPFQIFAKSEARYSIRYAFHVWIFLQAFLGEWLKVDVVTLLRDRLPLILSPLALISFYAWGKRFFGNARAALLAVAIQLLIYVTFANADGWGKGFFERSAQDKFLVWLIILPIALNFAWQFLEGGAWANWLGYGAALIAGLWVHPVSLILVLLTLAGFALFNLFSRVSFSRRRWGWLTVASIPALLSPIVIRATTLPSVFHVDTPDVAAYIRLSEGRLLFQPPNYIADPTLIAHPIILLGLALLVVLAPRLRDDVRAQFLWGSTLLPLALVFNPFTARILGEMLTPWQLWRLTWNLPIAFILTTLLLELPAWLRSLPQHRTHALAPAAALVLVIVAIVWLSNLNLTRSVGGLTKDHSLDPDVETMLRTVSTTLTVPSNVLLPRQITRYAPAFSYRAVVLSDDAQKEEDTRGQQIDRFYEKKADPKFLEAFLQFWKIQYAVVKNGSLQDKFLHQRPNTRKLYQNASMTLYEMPLP